MDFSLSKLEIYNLLFFQKILFILIPFQNIFFPNRTISNISITSHLSYIAFEFHI